MDGSEKLSPSTGHGTSDVASPVLVRGERSPPSICGQCFACCLLVTMLNKCSSTKKTFIIQFYDIIFTGHNCMTCFVRIGKTVPHVL